MTQFVISESDLGPGFMIKIEQRIIIFEGPPPKKTDFDLPGAATFLGVTPRHLRDLCKARKIRFAKPDYRTFRFTRLDLETYLYKVTTDSRK
jgi:excisionase family DNA binding protein